MSEHSRGRLGRGGSGPVQHIPAERVDTAHVHTRITGFLGDLHARIECHQVGLEPLGEGGIERGQDDPGIRVVAGQAPCPMDRDDGLSLGQVAFQVAIQAG